MPRYYFPSWDGDKFLSDEDGVEFEDLDQARVAAVWSLAEMARDSLPTSLGDRVLKTHVMDGAGEPLLELRLSFEIVGTKEPSVGLSAFPCKGRLHQTGLKRPSKRMASFAFAIPHSNGGIFRSFCVCLKTRNNSLMAL